MHTEVNNVQCVTTGGWTTEPATQAYLFSDQQELIHGRLPESCHMTRVAGTRLVLHVRTLVTECRPGCRAVIRAVTHRTCYSGLIYA